MAAEGRHRCGPHRLRCCPDATPAFGRRLTPRDAAAHPSPRAQLLADCIKEHGASFFDELMDVSGLLRSQVEEALAELVALGLVTSDSFGGLRALLVPSSERRTGPQWTKAAAHGRLWHGGCGPLGHGPALCRSRTQG